MQPFFFSKISMLNALSLLFSILLCGAALAEEMPEYEGVYARTRDGDLIPLQRLHEVSNLPNVSLYLGQDCTSCIQLTFSGVSSKVLPLQTYGSVKRINRKIITGFVIKSRKVGQPIFLDSIVEMRSHTMGQSHLLNPSLRGNPFEFVRGAFKNGRPTEELNSSVYSFGFPRRSADGKHHPPEELPPFLVLADCGYNESGFNIKPIDSVTTEYDYKFGNIGLIESMGRAASCGQDGTFSPVYGLALQWDGAIYPIISTNDYFGYRSKFIAEWGSDKKKLLPGMQ
jgi:hypothetical protein